MRRLSFTCDEGRAGCTLRRFLLSEGGLSTGAVKRAKADDAIFVNGVPSRCDRRLCPGDTVTVEITDPPRARALPEAGDIVFAYCDEDLYVIDKPAPLPCQATLRQPVGTLENRLSKHFENEPDFVFRPLNRLDKGTGGLMVAARNAHSCQRLQKTLHTDAFVREYLAVVEGRMQGEGVLTLPIARAPGATVRRCVDMKEGQEALTRYRVIYTGSRRSLVRLRLGTGRTHQIRVHLSSIGFPIVGDFLYGCEDPLLPGRFALHSTYLSFVHPLSGETLSFTSPLPGNLQKLLEEP